MMRFLTLVKVEWIKTMRMRATYIAFAATGLLVILVQLGLYFGAPKSDYYQFLEKNGFNTGILVNAYISTRFAMEVGFLLLAAPMIILTFARQVAGEDSRGTLRLILSRPISRIGLLNAKLFVCAVYCVMLMTFFISLSYGMGLLMYGPRDSITVGRWEELDPDLNTEGGPGQSDLNRRNWDNMTDQQRQAYREERRRIRREMSFRIATDRLSPKECAQRLAIAGVFNAWALLTVGSIAFFFSVINKHPIAAMALTIGAYFLSIIVQNLASEQNIIPIFTWLKPYLFTTSMDIWRGALSYTVDWARIKHDAILLGIYSVVFYAAACLIFWRKDITS